MINKILQYFILCNQIILAEEDGDGYASGYRCSVKTELRPWRRAMLYPVTLGELSY